MQVQCKKTLIHYNTKCFIKNKLYKIDEDLNDVISVFSEKNKTSSMIFRKEDGLHPEFYMFKFDDYFVTVKDKLNLLIGQDDIR